MRELSRTDRQVRELTALLGQPQSLISYHLGRLRAGRLVSMRRSSADRRDPYYTIDLTRCGELLAAVGAELHPGLRMKPSPPAAARPAAARPAAPPQPGSADGAAGSPSAGREPRLPRPRVLFLCTGNSARSQLAEALLAHLTGGTVEACSAGSHPKSLHPNAVRVMREHGIDLAGRRSKQMSEFAGQRFDYVITLCDRVKEICPEFPGHPEVMHWSIADPAREGGSGAGSYPAFQRTAADLKSRVGFLLHRIEERRVTVAELRA